PSLPVGDVPQFLHLRRERGLRGLEALDDLLVVLLRWQLRNRAERRAHLLHGALAGLEGQVSAPRGRFDARPELLQTRERFAARALVGFAWRAVASRERLLGFGVLRRDRGVDLAVRGERVPFLPDRRELAPSGGEILDGGAGDRRRGQFGDPR